MLSTADPNRQTATSSFWPSGAAWAGNAQAATAGATTMSRYKHLIGPKLQARIRSGQHGEVALAIQALNRMIRTAKPVSVQH